MDNIGKLNRKEMYALFYYILYLAYRKDGYYQKYLNILDKYAIAGNKIVSSYYSMGFDYLSIYFFDFILFNNASDLNAVLSDTDVQKKSVPFLNNFLGLINKLLSIVANEKFRSVLSRYKIRTSELIKIIESKMLDTVDEICLGLTNPLLNDNYMHQVYKNLINKGEINSRGIYLKDDKHPHDEFVSDDFKLELYYNAIKEYVGYVIKKLKEGNLENFKELFIDKIKKIGYSNVIKLLENLTDVDYKSLAFISLKEKNEYLKIYSKEFNSVLADIYEDVQFLNGEHIGRRIFRDKSGPSVRIYINLSNSNYGCLFLKEYISKCIKMSIKHGMKGFITTGSECKDRAVLYIEVEELPMRIKILNEIAIEHPDWIESFGTPLNNTGTFKNSYYGICHIGGIFKTNSGVWKNPVFTYNDYCDYIFTMSFYSLIAKLALDNNLIKSHQEKLLLSKWALLEDVNVSEGDDFTLEHKDFSISGIHFLELKKIVDIDKYVDILKKKGNLLNSVSTFELFRKRCIALSNIYQRRHVNDNGNICISKVMEDYAKHELSEKNIGEQSGVGGK